MSQNLGDFIVLRDGTILPDTTDMNAAYKAFMESHPDATSFTVWNVHTDPNIEFIACLWQVDAGVKACVTDREYNSVEFVGIAISDAVALIKQAQVMREAYEAT